MERQCYTTICIVTSSVFLFVAACDPKLMPSFPQHRNMKGQQKSSSNQLNIPLSNLNTGANDQTNNLPAISDLLGSLVKKRRLD